MKMRRHILCVVPQNKPDIDSPSSTHGTKGLGHPPESRHRDKQLHDTGDVRAARLKALIGCRGPVVEAMT
eukprot:1142632-Pelagomonas_calceolata.AAC.5